MEEKSPLLYSAIVTWQYIILDISTPLVSVDLIGKKNQVILEYIHVLLHLKHK